MKSYRFVNMVQKRKLQSSNKYFKMLLEIEGFAASFLLYSSDLVKKIYMISSVIEYYSLSGGTISFGFLTAGQNME